MAGIKLAEHHPFERALAVAPADLQQELRFAPIAWADFLLNPRRLRGSDFLMRWSQGVWSEHRLTKAVEETRLFRTFGERHSKSLESPPNSCLSGLVNQSNRPKTAFFTPQMACFT